MFWNYDWADGAYLIELDRILRPGGYWILSGPPINWERHWKGWRRTQEELKAEQDVIEDIARRMCWKKLVQRGELAIWQKPTNHIHCKKNRKVFKEPRFCQAQDPDVAWYCFLTYYLCLYFFLKFSFYFSCVLIRFFNGSVYLKYQRQLYWAICKWNDGKENGKSIASLIPSILFFLHKSVE